MSPCRQELGSKGTDHTAGRYVYGSSVQLGGQFSAMVQALGGGEAAERADQAEVWVVLPFNIEILNPEDLRTI